MHPFKSAIIDANNGDLILVEPGIYNEQIDFLGKNISLVSLPFSGYEDNNIGIVILMEEGKVQLLR